LFSGEIILDIFVYPLMFWILGE